MPRLRGYQTKDDPNLRDHWRAGPAMAKWTKKIPAWRICDAWQHALSKLFVRILSFSLQQLIQASRKTASFYGPIFVMPYLLKNPLPRIPALPPKPVALLPHFDQFSSPCALSASYPGVIRGRGNIEIMMVFLSRSIFPQPRITPGVGGWQGTGAAELIEIGQ